MGISISASFADLIVDCLSINRRVKLGERLLPSEDVQIVAVDERAVDVEEDRAEHRLASPRTWDGNRPPRVCGGRSDQAASA
ncbi:hypothetical protein [Sphingomonas sp. RS2018]